MIFFLQVSLKIGKNRGCTCKIQRNLAGADCNDRYYPLDNVGDDKNTLKRIVTQSRKFWEVFVSVCCNIE